MEVVTEGLLRAKFSMALEEIQPVAFVDDYLLYLRGIPASVHSALNIRDPNGSPNDGKELEIAQSMHADLQDVFNMVAIQVG